MHGEGSGAGDVNALRCGASMHTLVLREQVLLQL
jgi:hypothetical protein